MSERVFQKSSYSGHPQDCCIETSAPEGYTFKKSSYSDAAGIQCVEVGIPEAESHVLVRDSKFESGSPLIETSPEAFTAFVGGLATQEAFARIDA